ncbi:MAG: hypothetical protein KGJ78_10295 [Alphaproteobacteria bacterium]|nr:hypothetical protein [Alphaproteobacteria bacterium]
MKSAAFAAIAIVSASFALAPAANAAGISDCVHLAKQVSEAISVAQPGKATDDARAEASAARSFCAAAMYTQGVARYSKALQLLGKS